jgi:hypothetical protein
MAIWPFSRKGKRPRSQLTAPETADKVFSSHGFDQALTGEKPSHKRSKRKKSHHPQSSTGDASYCFPDPAPWHSHHTPAFPEKYVSAEATQNPVQVHNRHNHYSFSYTFDNHTSGSSIGQNDPTSVHPALLPLKRSNISEKGTLKKKLSKRSARDCAREEEIRLLSSSPPMDYTAPLAAHHSRDLRRGPSVLSRHANQHTSQLSLSLRDPTHSSLLEGSDSYIFKLNSFAVFTPRPVIRLRETHRQRQDSTSASTRKDKRVIVQAEDVHSRRRVAELADDLDAPTLRELLDRDRRRKEKKRLADLDRLQRRLQRRAEHQREEDIRKAPLEGQLEGQHVGQSSTPDERRGRSHFTVSISSSSQVQHDRNGNGMVVEQVKAQTGSWLRDLSKDSDTPSNQMSEGAHVIGNIDDRSIREGHSGQQYESALPADQQKPRNILPPSHFPDRGFQSSTSTSRLGPGSTSDISRTGDSDKHTSEKSGKRKVGWSFFGLGSSHRKRDSADLAQEKLSEFPNTSGESFSRIHSHSGPPPSVPERSFLRTGTVRHTQSKFKEHLGDYPSSPSTSQVQSPTFEAPEMIVDNSHQPDRTSACMEEQASPVSPISFVAAERDRGGESTSRHLSWETGGARTSPENGFSQSLASIDSEGSWMSGRFLRSISRATNTSIRRSVGSTTNRLEEYAEPKEDGDAASDEYFAQLASGTQGRHDSLMDVRRPSSSAIGIDDDRQSDGELAAQPETWSIGDGRQPTLVQPEQQPRSPHGSDGDVQMANTTHPEDGSPVEETTPVEIERATSIDFGKHHARHISAGSAKLLDIPARVSIDSKQLSAESTVIGESFEHNLAVVNQS